MRQKNYDDVTVTITTLIHPPLTHTTNDATTSIKNINSNFPPLFSILNYLLPSFKNKYVHKIKYLK